jgi:hypothetical protein
MKPVADPGEWIDGYLEKKNRNCEKLLRRFARC